MSNLINTLIALSIIVISIYLIFKIINSLAIALRARKVKNKKVTLPPKISRSLTNKDCLILYFSSPIAEKGNKKMSNVMKLINDEYKNVIKLDISKDKTEAELLNVISAPTTVIIDKNGTVRHYLTGFKPYPSIKSMIERITKNTKS